MPTDKPEDEVVEHGGADAQGAERELGDWGPQGRDLRRERSREGWSLRLRAMMNIALVLARDLVM